jgi:DNA-binding beta-propeller fold protein YncE
LGDDWRARGALLVGVLAGAAVLSGCGSGGSSHTTQKNVQRVSHVLSLAAPAGLIAGAAPQPDGLVWVLSGKRKIRTIGQIDLTNGKQKQAVGASSGASALAQSSTGVIALGVGTATTGAVQLLNASTGVLESTVAVGAPVGDVTFGDDGTTLYALNGTAKSNSVTVISTTTQKIVATTGLPSDALAIVPNPSQNAIWSVERSGSVQETSLANHKPLGTFSVGDPGVSIAVSPNGRFLYVLKRADNGDNIAVINTASERIVRLLPAARGSVALSISLDGRRLYDFVGTSRYGNIQVIDL